MLPELWKKEIINIQEEVDWVEETARQLIKDFAMLHIHLKFESLKNDKYVDLFSQATEEIGDLYVNHYEVFLNLLYRIDLDESKLQQLISATAPPLLYEQITELVLKREFLKVVSRYRYR